MKINDILQVIRGLAMSQGCYGRLYKQLMVTREQNPEQYSDIVTELENQHFSSALDLILYFEC